MKPSSFAYHVPSTLDEALSLLADLGDEAKVIAGGQSLIPLMNFRLAAPEHLVDINGLTELAFLTRQDGRLRAGAMTRHATLERSRLVEHHWPVLHEAIKQVAHPQIRTRGTIGGSVAHADSSAELPVVLAALEADFTAQSVRGKRTMGWRDFFSTTFSTALEVDELLTEVQIPPLPPGCGSAFVEYARRSGDFGLGGAAVLVACSEDGRVNHAAISLLGAAPTPYRATKAEALLLDEQDPLSIVTDVARAAVADISPRGDMHGSQEYRTRLIEALVRRALTTAFSRSEGTANA